MLRLAGVALLVMVCGGIATALYFFRGDDVHPATTAPRVIHPELHMLGSTVRATGTVRLRVGSEVRVGSQLSGIVRKLNVTVGSHVDAGEVIAEIDDASLRARIAQADAQAQVDKATLDRAEVNAARADKLASQGLIPLQQKQDAELALEESKAIYEKSLRDRDLVKVDLAYVQIHAPISGTVASVSTQEGETVQAAFTAPTFVTIIGDNSLELIAMVDEADIASVKNGNPVSFTVDSYPTRDFPGVVETIAPKATITAGVVNYDVTVTIRRDSKLLKPDMTANISIQTAQHEALVLPSQAVQFDGEKTFVYFSTASGPEKKPVVTGAKDGKNVEIKRGLSLGDDVLLAPQE